MVYESSKLGNFLGGLDFNSWMFLFLYNWSEVYHQHHILIEKNRTWRATKQLQIKLYLIKLWSLSWNSISRSLCARFRNPFWIWILFGRLWNSFAISYFSCNNKLLHHLAQKPSRSSSKNEIRRLISKNVFRTEKKLLFQCEAVHWFLTELSSVVLGFCLRSTTSEM